MTTKLPYLFYGLIKIGHNEARRMHLTPNVAQRLTAEFISQKDDFLAESEAVSYDPQYKPDEGEEHFLIKGYDLPVAFKKVMEGPDVIPGIEPDDFDCGRVRCIFGMSQNPNKREFIFQNFDSRSVLKRGSALNFLARKDRFVELEETAVTLPPRITAYFDGNDLYFRSIHLVSRYLDLDQVFTAATNDQIKEFVAHKRFAPVDTAAFIAVSDVWIRKKVSVINVRRIIDKVPIPEIRKVAKQFQVKFVTKPGPDGKDRIVLPTDKKELKDLLRLFAQDLLQCAMTQDKFRVNSKARIGDA